MVASYLQDRGMTVTRNAQLNTMQYDLIAKTNMQGHTLTLGVAVTFERIIALAPDTIANTVRRQALFQDCLWVKSNLDAIVKGTHTAASSTNKS
jgi:hypothetical protein